MFRRLIEKELAEWKESPQRKPLVMRGARQTGKTTLVEEFGRQYEVFINLNLEKDEHRRIFSEVKDAKQLLQSIEGITGKMIRPSKTLLFLDEIQNSGVAINMLRYFHEELSELHVIAAGSLLEVRMRRGGWSFPVGRVEFIYLYPATFEEFLLAAGNEIAAQTLRRFTIGEPIPLPLHEKLLDLLADYLAVGGMPEAVANYIETKSFASARNVHESLNASFKDDFAKYSKESEVGHLKIVWDRLPFEIGNRIKYSAIGGLQVRAHNISKAFDILHEAMLAERIYPTTQTVLPLVRKAKSAPKTVFLDIGLCTHALNISRDQIREKIIDPRYAGGLFEQFVGQEMLASDSRKRADGFFWVREEKGTSSELDFLMQLGGRIFPIEVKSGSHGSLKSLHQFLFRSKTGAGVRLYQGLPASDKHNVVLPDGSRLDYSLVSLPLYLAFRLKELLGGIPKFAG